MIKNENFLGFSRKEIQKNLLTNKPAPLNEEILIKNITSVDSSPAVEQWRAFFLTDFSYGFLNRISYDLYGGHAGHIQGEYYLFISPLGGKDNIPYYKVSLYSRQNGAKLKSYLSSITTRYFYNKRAKELKKDGYSTRLDESTKIKKDFSGSDVIENPWFALLIYDGDENSLSSNDMAIKTKLIKMIEKLPEKEQIVIQMSYFENFTGDEIFEELLSSGLIKPKRDVSILNVKDKQDAVANIRKRAITHLKTLMS